MKTKIFKPLIVILFSIGISFPALSQHTFNNSVSQYYRDGYLWNPALAGKEGLRFYGLFSNSWSGFDGSAKLIGLAADMRFAENMGAGVHLTTYSSGVFKRYSGELSYAYQMNIQGKTNLRIGGGLSFYKGQLDSKELVSGNGQVDPVAASYNDKSLQFNGSLGLYLTMNHFVFGATGYNLSTYFKESKDKTADMQIGQLLSSYQIQFTNERLSLTPLAAYKMYYKSDNIFLVAAQLQYAGLFHTGLYWQSTGSVMGGLGVILKKFGEINFFYTGKNKYGRREQYEIGVKYNIN